VVVSLLRRFSEVTYPFIVLKNISAADGSRIQLLRIRPRSQNQGVHFL